MGISWHNLCTHSLQSCLFLSLLRLLLRFWGRQLEALRLSVDARADLLPCTRAALEVSEGLRHLKRLCDNSLLLLVVPHFRVARQWEILAQRVALETVVGHDTSQIWVANKEDTHQVVSFSLVPVGTLVQRCYGWYGGSLVGIGFDTDARIVAYAEEVVDNLKPLVARGEIDGCDVTDLSELGGSVICSQCKVRHQLHGTEATCIQVGCSKDCFRTFQKGKYGDDSRGRDVDGQFILPHRELLYVLGQAAHQPRAISVEVVGLGLVLVGGVDDRGLQCAKLLSLQCPRVRDVCRKANAVRIGTSGGGERPRRDSFVTRRWDGLHGPQGLCQHPASADFACHFGIDKEYRQANWYEMGLSGRRLWIWAPRQSGLELRWGKLGRRVSGDVGTSERHTNAHCLLSRLPSHVTFHVFALLQTSPTVSATPGPRNLFG